MLEMSESEEYIKNRNYLCDLLGNFKTLDGENLEILYWRCNPHRLEDPLSVTTAGVHITPSEDPEKIQILTYDEVLEKLGKKRYIHKRK